MAIALPAGSKIYLSLQPVDMRKGFDGLAAQVQQILARDPFSGHLFLFHGRRGDRLKALWWDGGGLCLFAKRLERGRFVWPRVEEGAITLTPAQLAMLIEGLEPPRVCRRLFPLRGWSNGQARESCEVFA